MEQRRREPRRRAWAAALLATALCAASVATAHAQLGDVGEDVLDTDNTPVAKESVKWEWWAGAQYKGAPKPSNVPQGSATPFELDFFDVAFHDLNTGLAGGAICREPVPDRATSEEARAYTEQCERVPALYRYSVDEAGKASWSPLDLGESTERRGYVGAIAWLDSDTALAVGGDGCYPRREEPCPDGEVAAGDDPVAGKGRAWLYDGGSIAELDVPDTMRGLTALGTHSGGAFAGALRQIWRFQGGAFTTGWSGDASTPQDVRYPELFQFRVRDIRGASAATAGCCRTDPLQSAGPRLLTFDGSTWIVTRRPSDFSNTTERFDDQSKSEPLGDPLPGAFDSVEGAVEDQWTGIGPQLWTRLETLEKVWDNQVRRLADRCNDSGGLIVSLVQPERSRLGCFWQNGQGLLILGNPLPEGLEGPTGIPWPDLPDNVIDDPDDPGEESVLGPFGLGSPPDLGPAPHIVPGPAPDILPLPPDTSDVRDPVNDTYRDAFGQLYGATKFMNGWGVDGHSVNTHTQAQAPDSYYALFGVGGTVASPGGPPPGSGEDEPGSVISNGPRLLLTTARLLSADESPVKGGLEAVGMLRSNGQGILVGGDEHDPHRVNDSLSKPQDFRTDEEAHGCKIQDPTKVASGVEEPECDTNAQRFLDQQRSLRLFKLDSYALNAIDVVQGAGWAVGDHGAIHSRQPPPPPPPAPPQPPARAGAKLESESVSSDAFKEHRPAVTDEPGTVPALTPGTQPAELGFHDPQTVFGGTEEIVMSRDGSEGWAFASSSNEPPLHYDGSRWATCDAAGVPGLLPPDPACAGIGAVQAVTRVPLERDADPTNDEEFEAVALTNDGIYRLRRGRWFRDKEAMVGGQPISGDDDVAFTAPDDGWVTGAGQAHPAGNTGGLFYHFDGQRWVGCFSKPQACDSPDGRTQIFLPSINRGHGKVRLAAAGDRVYLFSFRESAEPLGPITVPYPVILYHDASEPCQKANDPGCWRGGIDDTDPDSDDDPNPGDGVYHDDGAYDPADGGWDPGCVQRQPVPDPLSGEKEPCVATGRPADQGRAFSLAVAQDADGSYQGWAVGTFGGLDPDSARAVLMRLEDGSWTPWTEPDAANDYFRAIDVRFFKDNRQLTLPSETGRRNAFLFGGSLFNGYSRTGDESLLAPALAFDQTRGAQGRWAAIPTPWSSGATRALRYPQGIVVASAADGQGGFWASVCRCRAGFPPQGGTALTLHHYTDRAPTPVFEEAANPARDETITAMAASQDGTVWLGDDRGRVYRYDRLAGWSRPIRIPGWDPKQATTPAAVSAIAVGPDGEGVAVGPGGRIAKLGERVGLDPAATASCASQDAVPPCGSAKDLFAAAVAPDGSALVAGEEGTLLWRPAGGDFRRIATPPLSTAIARISMPSPDRAWLLTTGSQVIAGQMSAPGQWSWRIEIGGSGGNGDPLTDVMLGSQRRSAALNDLALDAQGHGFAVGANGVLLERTGAADSPWRRVESGYRDDLQRVALPAAGGEGALIGAVNGRLLTLVNGRLEVARHSDLFDPAVQLGPARVIGLALVPGYRPGEAEAWALLRSVPREVRSPWTPQTLLHHPSDSADPLLDPSRGLPALADAPLATAGELSFAAFGKQDCQGAQAELIAGKTDACWAPNGSNLTNELIAGRVVEEIVARSERPSGPGLALFTGDAVDMPGDRETVTYGVPFDYPDNPVRTPLDSDVKHRRWVELVPDRLAEHGVAVAGAIGGQDLARNLESCSGKVNFFLGILGLACPTARGTGAEQLGLEQGANLPWRAAMATTPAPWEGEQEASGLRLEPVGAGALSQDGPDVEVPGLVIPEAGAGTGSKQLTGVTAVGRTRGYHLGSGDTHYAQDVYRADEKVARIVVVDTSMRSLAASDPQQHPIEAGGQLRWLDEMLCFEGSPEDTDDDVRDCTREPDQQAIVVSNTPTYSYGPISPAELQADAAVFESVLLKNQVNVVVSGRLGWQGRYWALAPGVHSPCPGQPYRADSQAPSSTNPEICGAGSGAEFDPDEAIEQLPDEAKDTAGLAARGAIPFVVSSTAGGKFNVRASQGGFASAENGFWRGYSLVRLHPSGDPAKTIVEQRPILDWVGVEVREQELEPRAEVDVRGYAREAFGMDTAPRYYDIPDHEGITHRYHLLLAHPKEPWRACEAGDSVCEAYYSKLAEGSRSFDSASSEAARSAQDDNEGASGAAGDGGANASAAPPADGKCSPYLCLPERVGTIDPITGEVRAGNGKYPNTFALATLAVGDHVAAHPLVFKRSPSFVVSPALSAPAVPSPPTSTGTAPAPPPPPNPPTPNVPQASTPQPPAPPPIAPLQASEPPEPQPPAPPAPPPPSEAPAPISLTLAPPSITVATPTAVIQPPTPPVNPAPPGGARREARQRQAATQKSGADSAEGGSEQGQVDIASKPPSSHGAEMTRLDHSFTAARRGRPEPSFTALSRSEPSAGGQALLYTGGITVLAFALAAGWSRGRPTPRRRTPELPAPALSELRWRR